MSFNENDVNRDKSGKFDHKEGSAPGISLTGDDFVGLPSADVQERIFDNAAKRAHDSDGGGFSPETLDIILQEDFPDVKTLDPGEEELPDISDFEPHAGALPDLDGYDPHAQRNIQQVIATLNSGHITDSGITSDDLGKLREAIERAEYNLVDNSIKEYLSANHPEVKGILVESDGYDSPSFVGLEIEDGSEPVDGRNYGTVIGFDERYGDLYAHLYNYSEDIARFQDRGSFDEFATVLTDDNEEFGRFQGLYGDMPTDTPTYRIAARD